MTLPQIVMMLMQMVVAVPIPMVVLCGKYGAINEHFVLDLLGKVL
jgi:uncharacterized membrane protein YqaE (UPF0057 family)